MEFFDSLPVGPSPARIKGETRRRRPNKKRRRKRKRKKGKEGGQGNGDRIAGNMKDTDLPWRESCHCWWPSRGSP